MSTVRDLIATVDIDADLSSLNSLNSAMDGLESQLVGLGGHVDSAMSDFNALGNNGSDSINEIQDAADDAISEIEDLGDNGADAINEIQDAADDAVNEIDDLGDVGQDSLDDIENAADDATNSVDNLGNGLNDAGQQGVNSAGVIGSSFKKLIGIFATVFAVDKIKDFATSLIESAAESSAMGAQYEQVFGDVQESATSTIDTMGKNFGMVPTRLKPAFTQMTSMFKGLGMDTEQSMGQAEKAVTLSADAAAFYDKSYEDANGALNSFIKGNYEGGEAIGLFGNETQLSSWASKELGIEWKTLDEAGKQIARLEFAKTMQGAAGATGQAARESDGYQNVLGNLKQNWTDLKAKLGERILAPAIDGLMSLSEWVKNVDTDAILDGFAAFGDYMSGTFGPVLDDAKAFIGAIWDEFEKNGGVEIARDALDGIQIGLAWLKDNSGVITAGLAGVAGAFAAFRIITFINAAVGVFNTLMIAMQTGTLLATLAQYGLNTAMLANPITWVAVGIGALIAIGILLYKNWDTVSAKTKEVWDSIGGLGGAMALILGPIGFLINAGIDLAKNWDSTKSVWENVWGAIQRSAATSINAVIGLINNMIEVINKIPGVNIPIVAKVDWGAAKEPSGAAGISNAKGVDGSHANGLESVPFDGYIAELHKGERVQTAEEVQNERNGGGYVGAPPINITINGGNDNAETIGRIAAAKVKEEMATFWRQMSLKQV